MSYRILTLRYRILTPGYRILTLGYRILTLGYRILTPGYRILTLGYRILTLGYRILTLGYRILTLGYRILTLGRSNLQDDREIWEGKKTELEPTLLLDQPSQGRSKTKWRTIFFRGFISLGIDVNFKLNLSESQYNGFYYLIQNMKLSITIMCF